MTVKVKMDRYMSEMISNVPKGFNNAAEMKAVKRLFHVNPSAEPLDSEKAAKFHLLVAKWLFLYKRARPDCSWSSDSSMEGSRNRTAMTGRS